MEPVEVYVDGACRNNGHNNPQAGCGVYWGPVHPLNFAETLQGDKQTNNRGELSAAIIALTQAITCKIKWIKITTDSKYVKNGITEWIKEWRVNDWKTTKRKGDREVLNKDLWLTLDYLQQQLTVDWQWVEGHKDNEGNRKADDLAKMGISAETSVWQQMASKWYDEKNCDVLAISCESVSPKNQEESKVVKPQYICKTCSQQCKEEEDAPNANFGCIITVRTYRSINSSFMSLHRGNARASFALMLMKNSQIISNQARTSLA